MDVDDVLDYIKVHSDIFLQEMMNIKGISNEKPRTHDQWDTTVESTMQTHLDVSEQWTLSCPELTNGNKWYHFPIMMSGQFSSAARKLLPGTVEVFEAIDGVYTVGLSLILERSMITFHTDSPHVEHEECGTWTYHLGLACPPHCYVIQNETLLPQTNNSFIKFRSNQEHAAINMSSAPRVILFVSFCKNKPIVRM
jgi:aspartyl/asparaginyl beta-hydroxylase (cupin superfamily)